MSTFKAAGIMDADAVRIQRLFAESNTDWLWRWLDHETRPTVRREICRALDYLYDHVIGGGVKS